MILDFALAKTSNPYVLSAPILVVVAKNDDLASGLGEVISAMRAADFSNRISNIATTVYGLCTTGTEWRFMKCDSKVVTLNRYDFYIDNVGKILGVLQHIVRSN